jgi:hypothetical protein
MKRLFLLAALAVLSCATTAPAETAHNLLQQNNRTLAPYDLSVIPELLKSNANVFFVDNEATEASDTADGIHGETPGRPFQTYDFAIGQCTAGQNNIIVIMPYSTEHYTAAGSVDVDVTGITTIGLGYGPARPKFVFDHADATFVVGRTGDGATFENLTFQASVTGVTVGVQVEDGADNISWVDCEWLNGELSGTDEFVTAMDVVTEANDVSFERCRFISVGAGATSIIKAAGGAITGLTFKDCYAYGDWSTALMVSDQILTRVLVENCSFENKNSGEPIFEFTGTSNVGMVTHCAFVNDGTANDMGGISLVGNDYKTSGDSNTDGRSAEIADGVTDEATAGHRTAATVGAMLQPLTSGTATAGSATTITLQNTASALASFYKGNTIQIIAGSGIGQSRVISAYAVTSYVATVSPDWITNPSSDSVYVIYGNAPTQLAVQDPVYGRMNYFVVSPGAFDTTGAWSTVSGDGEHEVITVTGACRIRILIEVVTAVTSTSDTGTIAFGYEGNTAALFAAYTLGAGAMATGDICSVSGTTLTTPISGTLFANAFMDFVVTGGKDVGYVLATNAATGGEIKFHVWWAPLDSTGLCVAGAGGTM